MTTDIDIITALARKLEAENTRLRAENAELRAGRGRWPEAPPRLTVHKLNVAPDGSKLDATPFRGVFRKLDGNWVNQQGTLRAPEYIINEYPDATITYPEDQR